jgi:hypothetical protein
MTSFPFLKVYEIQAGSYSTRIDQLSCHKTSNNCIFRLNINLLYLTQLIFDSLTPTGFRFPVSLKLFSSF